MNTRRSKLARFASTLVITATFLIGAQAFVPSAFGCSSSNSSDCKSGSRAETGDSFMDHFKLLIIAGKILIP